MEISSLFTSHDNFIGKIIFHRQELKNKEKSITRFVDHTLHYQTNCMFFITPIY